METLTSSSLLEWSKSSLHFPSSSTSSSFLQPIVECSWHRHFAEMVRRVRSKHEARVIRGNVAIFDRDKESTNVHESTEHNEMEFVSKRHDVQRSHEESVEGVNELLKELRQLSHAPLRHIHELGCHLEEQTLIHAMRERRARRERMELKAFSERIEEELVNLHSQEEKNNDSTIVLNTVVKLKMALEEALRNKVVHEDSLRLLLNQIWSQTSTSELLHSFRNLQQSRQKGLRSISSNETVTIDSRWTHINPEGLWDPHAWLNRLQREQIKKHECTLLLTDELKELQRQYSDAMKKCTKNKRLELEAKRVELYVDNAALLIKAREQQLFDSSSTVKQLERECEEQGQILHLKRVKHAQDIEQLCDVNTVFIEETVKELRTQWKEKKESILNTQIKELSERLDTLRHRRKDRYSGSGEDEDDGRVSKRRKLCRLLNIPSNSGPMEIINEIRRLKDQREVLRDPKNLHKSATENLLMKSKSLEVLKVNIGKHDEEQVRENVLKLRSELYKLKEGREDLRTQLSKIIRTWHEQPAQKIIEADNGLKYSDVCLTEWKERYNMALFQWQKYHQQSQK